MTDPAAAAAANVSAMIISLDEEIHPPSHLAALAWTDDVIVVDSLSAAFETDYAWSNVARRMADAYGTILDKR